MKIPSNRHPHGALQRELQSYDPNLWLVFSPRIRRWLVLFDGVTPIPTPPALRGMEGCCGERTTWQVAKTIWGRRGEYIDPSLHYSLVVDAVKNNDSKNSGGVADRIARVDASRDARAEAAKKAYAEETKSVARDAWDKYRRGRVMKFADGSTLDYVSNRNKR